LPAKVRAPAACVISSNAVEASNPRRPSTLAEDLAFALAGPPDWALAAAEFVIIAFP
jgi:hypothetical protein